MNHDDERFGELLRNVPFDDAFRQQHFDDVCERALRAFDQAAIQGPITVANRTDPRRSWFTRRRVVRIAVAVAVAASIGAVMLTWQRGGSDPWGSDTPAGRPVVRTEAQRQADENLLAAVSVLNELADDRTAPGFDRGIEVCLVDRDAQIAFVEQ